jgi:Short C-terminal domain
MPGLIRGVARTAAIAGTATAVSNGVSRRQAGRWAEKDQQQQAQAYSQQQYEQAQYAQQQQQYAQPQQQYAPPPAPAAAAPTVDIVGELTKLAQLKDAGALSEAEFEAAKAKLLG